MLPPIYKARIDYWNSKGLRVTKPGTKTFNTIVELLKDCVNGTGTYVGRPITRGEFRLSVDRFADTVFNDKLRPVNKAKIKSTSLGDFIYNKWAKPPYNYGLLHFAENPPEPIITIHKTALFDHLCQSFVEKCGSGSVDRLSIEQLENISLASKKLTEFVAKHKGKINNDFLSTHKQLTDTFVDHVVSCLKDNLTKFNTRSLTYNSVWEMLPNFFEQHSYFVATKRLSMRETEEKDRERKRRKEETNASTPKRPTLKRRRPRLVRS